MKPATEMVLILGITGLILIGIECASRTLILPKSKIERRTEAEFNEAVAINEHGKHRTLLLLGNSLLGKGIEMPMLSSMLPADWKAKRILVEDTAYYDWYYGMHNLFLKGSRPDVVVLMLSIKQLTSNSIRGEYSAYRMMDFLDLPNLAADLHMHPTAASGLLVGNLSAFYGTRVEIRKKVLDLLIPDFSGLTKLLVSSQVTSGSEKFAAEELRSRFGKLRELSEQKSIPIAVLIAPESGLRDEILKKVCVVAADANFNVLVPVKPDELSTADYSDGFHLNAGGAAKFTKSFGEMLRCHLPGESLFMEHHYPVCPEIMGESGHRRTALSRD